MKCTCCGNEIIAGEEMERNGQTVCEDCYIDMAAKPKTCDPWAVYSARNIPEGRQALNEIQQGILKVLAEKGESPPESVAAALKIDMSDFEREFAVLRHMEKVQGRLVEGKKMIRLADSKA